MFKDGSDLYVATGPKISKIDLNTGEVVTLVVGQDTAWDLAVTANDIYWMNHGNQYYPPLGSLNRIPRY